MDEFGNVGKMFSDFDAITAKYVIGMEENLSKKYIPLLNRLVRMDLPADKKAVFSEALQDFREGRDLLRIVSGKKKGDLDEAVVSRFKELMPTLGKHAERVLGTIRKDIQLYTRLQRTAKDFGSVDATMEVAFDNFSSEMGSATKDKGLLGKVLGGAKEASGFAGDILSGMGKAKTSLGSGFGGSLATAGLETMLGPLAQPIMAGVTGLAGAGGAIKDRITGRRQAKLGKGLAAQALGSSDVFKQTLGGSRSEKGFSLGSLAGFDRGLGSPDPQSPGSGRVSYSAVAKGLFKFYDKEAYKATYTRETIMLLRKIAKAERGSKAGGGLTPASLLASTALGASIAAAVPIVLATLGVASVVVAAGLIYGKYGKPLTEAAGKWVEKKTGGFVDKAVGTDVADAMLLGPIAIGKNLVKVFTDKEAKKGYLSTVNNILGTSFGGGKGVQDKKDMPEALGGMLGIQSVATKDDIDSMIQNMGAPPLIQAAQSSAAAIERGLVDALPTITPIIDKAGEEVVGIRDSIQASMLALQETFKTGFRDFRVTVQQNRDVPHSNSDIVLERLNMVRD